MAEAARTGMFSSLVFRDFRLLWLGNIAATFAMQMQMVARGWLIYDMTASPMALTWVMLSFMLPSVVFSLAGGVIADRLRKRSIMIVSGIFNTVATAALAAIVYSGEVTFWKQDGTIDQANSGTYVNGKKPGAKAGPEDPESAPRSKVRKVDPKSVPRPGGGGQR